MKSFQLWTILFALCSVCFHLFSRLVLHRHGYLAYPFSRGSARFADFTIFSDKFKLFHTLQFFQFGFPINYPAPVSLCFEVFFKLAAPHSLFAFVAFSVLSFLVPAALFARALIRRGIAPGQAWPFCAIVCLFSWPALLIVDRGNAEVFVWLTLLIAMWAYATGRLWLAAAFFGVAASLKLFPFIFLALFLSRRHIWKLFFGIAVFLAVSIVSLKVLGPTIAIAYRGIAFGLASFKTNYMSRWLTNESGVDHSLFSSIKLFLILVLHHNHHGFPHWLSAYLIATAGVGTLLYFLRIRKMPLLNQVLALTIASIYFTAFSGDGTLIHLYYPLAMLFFLAIEAWRDGVSIPGLSLILYCMVFCLSLETFLVVRILPNNALGARFIGPAHSIGLGIMLIAALIYPLGPALSERDDEIVLSEPGTAWAGAAGTNSER